MTVTQGQTNAATPESVSLDLVTPSTPVQETMSTPTSDLEQLYRRAIADPRSITRAEHNLIRDWPPPEEEDRLCVARTGLKRAQLVAKALANPDELTLEEAMIVHHTKGIHFDAKNNLNGHERLMHLKRRHEDPSPLELLHDEAANEVWKITGEEEKMAMSNALKRRFAIEKAESDVMYRQWEEYEAAKRLKEGTPWIKHMVKNGLFENGKECWGFVIFRTGCYDGEEGEAAWQRFREYFAKAAETNVLHWNSGPLLWPKFRAFFVEDKELDGASNEELRARFRKMRDGEGNEDFPKGIRTNCFLVADMAIIESEAAKAPYLIRYNLAPSVDILPEDPVVYIRAVDPDYETPTEAANEKENSKKVEDEAEDAEITRRLEAKATAEAETEVEEEDQMAGFTGEVVVALPRVFDWLHCVCFSAENGTSRNDGWLYTGWKAIYIETRAPEDWERNYSPHSGGISYNLSAFRYR